MKHLFNKTAQIIRMVHTSDNMGGFTEEETVLYDNWKCRINWTKGIEKNQFDKTTHFRDAKVYGNISPEIIQSDIFKYEDKDYEIVNISNVDELDKYLILEIKIVE